MRKRIALVVSVGVTGLLTWSGAPVVGAAPSWTSPQVLSVAGAAEGPQVAVASDGRALVVWEGDTAQGSHIVSAARGVAGVWGAPKALGPIGDQVASSQQVAMNDHGFAVVTWVRSGRVFTAVRAAGAWSPERRISAGGGGSFPQVAVTKAGGAYVVWQQVHGVKDRVLVVRRSADGRWSQPSVLPSGFGDGQYPQVAVDALGHATVVWQRMWGDGGRTAALMSRLSHGRWSATRRLSAAKGNAGAPLLAMNARGDTVVTWNARQHGRLVVRGVVRPPAGPWRTARTVATGSLTDLALGRTGAAVVGWTRYVSGEYRFGLARRPAGGSWQPGVLLWSADVQTTAPVVAMGGGAIAVAWMTDAVRAVRQDGGAWGLVTPLGGTGVSYYQQVAMDSVGRAVVVWKQWNGVRDVVMASSSAPH